MRLPAAMQPEHTHRRHTQHTCAHNLPHLPLWEVCLLVVLSYDFPSYGF